MFDFAKNIHNITDNRRNRKRKTKLYSNVVKCYASSTEGAPESGNPVFDLKKIQSILLRDENLKSSEIENSPPDICTDSSSSGNVFIECWIRDVSHARWGALEELQKPIIGTTVENEAWR